MSGVPQPGSGVLPYLQEASQGTGLPLSVVEAQNLAESAYGTNLGPSSAGAEGPWQFLPSTYASVGGAPGGINLWGPSTKAYITYMDELLKQEGGNIFKALEAYNAGPGNLPAGAGYASSILSQAGVSPSASAGSATLTSFNPGGIIGGIIGGFTGAATGNPNPSSGDIFGSLWSDLGNLVLQQFGVPNFKDLFQRLGLILLGAILLIIGVNMLTRGVVAKATSLTGSAPEAMAQAPIESEQPDTQVLNSQTGTAADASGTSPEFRDAFLGGGSTGSASSGLVSESIEAAAVAL